MKVHSDRTGVTPSRLGNVGVRLCFFLLCVVGLVCSCSRNDDLLVNGDPVDAAFAGSFVKEEWGDAERAGTRVSDGKWTKGDAVGVYMLPSGSYALSGAVWKNRKQVIDDNKMTPDGIANKLYYPLNGSDVRFVAYYPYTESASATATLNKVSFDFSNQSTQPLKEAKDFMFHRGTADYSKAKPNASLGFSHKFSKIWITVNRGSGGPSVKDVAVTLGKMPQSATVDLDKLSQQSGDITVGTQAATITAATLSSTTETATVEAIVAPHTGTGSFADRTFTFNAGGQTKTYTLPDNVTFSSGYAYHFTFSLRKDCTITYKANGGSGNDIVRTVFANDAYLLESNTFTAPDGDPFYGWNTQADGLGTDYAAGQSITPTANMTLYAQWAGIINLATTTVPTGVSYAGNVFTINNDGNYRVINSTTANRIVVKSGVTATVTLSSASINVSGTASACAFDMAGATVTLKLKGTNVLKSGTTQAGLRVPSGANLTIAGSTGGKLTATGGNTLTTANNNGAGAGIGGNGISGAGEAGGSVTINSGTVEATGGTSNAGGGNGAGIGGGGGKHAVPGNAGGAGGTVTINGGTVTAIGGGTSGMWSGGGAGIGGGGGSDDNGTNGKGGAGGAGGTVIINGGTVTATGGKGDTSYGGGGAGIGGGGGSDGGKGGAEATYSGPGSATVNATGGTGKNAGASIGKGGNS